jgi:hypothetical protein
MPMTKMTAMAQGRTLSEVEPTELGAVEGGIWDGHGAPPYDPSPNPTRGD